MREQGESPSRSQFRLLASYTLRALAFGLGIGLSLCIALLGLDVYQSHQKSKVIKNNFALSVMKVWPTCTLMGSWQVTVKTKWEDGLTRYQVNLSGELDGARLRMDPDANMTLVFLDADGFTVDTTNLKRSEMVSLRDPKAADPNQIFEYEWKGESPSSAENYRRYSSLSIHWKGIELLPNESSSTKAMKEPSGIDPVVPYNIPSIVTPWVEASNWRRLAKGMGPDQVKAILGTPTRVESAYFTVWIYGGKTKYKHPYVEFNAAMQVSGWKEP